jgi:hypothetical protein
MRSHGEIASPDRRLGKPLSGPCKGEPALGVASVNGVQGFTQSKSRHEESTPLPSASSPFRLGEGGEWATSTRLAQFAFILDEHTLHNGLEENNAPHQRRALPLAAGYFFELLAWAAFEAS